MVCGHFQQKYDKVQGLIQQIGCMDELLSGKYLVAIAVRLSMCRTKTMDRVYKRYNLVPCLQVYKTKYKN